MISFVQPASRSNAALLAVEEFTAAPAILMFRRKPIAMSFPPQPIEKEPMLPPLKPWLRRHLRTRWLRTAVVTFILWNVLDLVHTIYRLESAQAAANTSRTFEKQEKVYIAGMHWNNEIILRSHWNDALVALTRHFGAENVYVSIYESGSWDNSKDALRMLDAQLEQLGVRKTIILDETTHIDEISKPPEPTGWIDTPRGKRELRRIPYLAKIRNATLKPMEDLAAAGEIFDKVLFLNDVVFTTQDIMNLFQTNGGDYAAACSLDFSKPPKYYDTFALRDAHGYEHLTQTWPYFRSTKSQSAMKVGAPVPVKSCWNGIIVMDSAPFYDYPTRLRFRGIPDTLAMHHLEGSECCLVHADNPLSKSKGVWMNPNVRVGYNPEAYDRVNPPHLWLSTYEIFTGMWENRVRRWVSTQWFKSIVVHRRVKRWQRQEKGRQEPGEFCLINEMQVLVHNGWAHV